MTLQKLKSLLACLEQEDYPQHSRVHKLQIGRDLGVDCYIKREDELGCLLSGSKVRKYRSLIPALKKARAQEVGLIGGSHSNHILGLSSLLIENNFVPTLFLCSAHEKSLIGNALFSRLMVPERNIFFIERANWPHVEEIAATWQQQAPGRLVVPEGGATVDCIAGLATLACDIITNEEAIHTPFQELLIDSGTGLTAACLIATFGYLQRSVKIHVCLAASNEAAFRQKLNEAKSALETLTQEKIATLPDYVQHTPPVAPSFGATNSTIFRTIAHTAKHEGLFLDPIYSSKLYLLLETLLKEKALQGPVLFIHSGGLFSLSGFQESLTKQLD